MIAGPLESAASRDRQSQARGRQGWCEGASFVSSRLFTPGRPRYARRENKAERILKKKWRLRAKVA